MAGFTKEARKEMMSLFSKGLKKCPRCKDTLSLDKFRENKLNMLTGRYSKCIKCENEISKEWARAQSVKKRKLSGLLIFSEKMDLFKIGLKYCGHCETLLSVEMFNVCNSSATKRTSWCTACINKDNIKRRVKRNKESGRTLLIESKNRKRKLLLKHGLKQCSKCMKTLTMENFTRSKTGNGSNWCNDCYYQWKKKRHFTPGRNQRYNLLISMGLQFCSGCHKLLPLDDFHKTSAKKHNHHVKCKECTKIEGFRENGGFHRSLISSKLAALNLHQCTKCGEITSIDPDGYRYCVCKECRNASNRIRWESPNKGVYHANRSLVKLGVKICAKCETILPVNSFSPCSNGIIGYDPNCKKCNSLHKRPISTISIEQQLSLLNMAKCACGGVGYKKNMGIDDSGNFLCEHCTKINEYQKMTLAQKKQKRRDELFKRGLRLCERCYEISELSNFYNDKDYPNGKKIYCNSCDRDRKNRRKGSYKIIEAKELLKYGLRKCGICSNTKPLSEFNLDTYYAKSGHGYICLECSRKIAKAKRRKEQSDLSDSTLREYVRKHIGDPGDKYIDYLIPNARIGIATEPSCFCSVDGSLFLTQAEFTRYAEEKYGMVKRTVLSRLERGATAEQAILPKKEYLRVRKEEKRERENI